MAEYAIKLDTERGTIMPFPGNVHEEPHHVKLKKDGTPKQIVQNKKKGVKSEVYSFEPEDIKLIADNLLQHEKWHHYLIFILGCNMARRIGDTLALRWEHFFDPKTGEMRTELLSIREEKTGKLVAPYINLTCQKAIELFIEKTKCDPSEENYTKPVFLMREGNYKGRVMSADAYRKAIKKAAADVGIKYNVGTHSSRKTFGAISKMLHPGDHNSMEVLQTIYNHSDSKTTNRYIGLTKKNFNRYYEDIGQFFDEHVTGDKEMVPFGDSPMISLASGDMLDIIKMAYEAGQKNAGNTDAMTHVDAITEIMSFVEQIVK